MTQLKGASTCDTITWQLAHRLLLFFGVKCPHFLLLNCRLESSRLMRRRLFRTLVITSLSGFIPASYAAAQQLTSHELERVDEWFRRTSERTGDGEWGVAIGTMDGRVLWSQNSELELIPASTAK